MLMIRMIRSSCCCLGEVMGPRRGWNALQFEVRYLELYDAWVADDPNWVLTMIQLGKLFALPPPSSRV